MTAQTANNDCTARPHRNGTIDGIGIRTFDNGRRYAECGHPVEKSEFGGYFGRYCGALIDVTDMPLVTPHICCGAH